VIKPLKALGYGFIGVALATFSSAAIADKADSRFAVDVAVHSFQDFEPQFPEKRTFGALTFKGGASLSAQIRSFGGFSGMQIGDGGKTLLAVSDTGFWLAADIVRDQNGAVSGLQKAHMARLYSGEGPRIDAPKYYVDAEALVRDGSTLYVAFEAINVISRYRLDRATLQMEPQILSLPEDITRIGINKGMEALALAPQGSPLAGHLIAITERGEGRGGPTFGWIIDPEGHDSELSGMFRVARDNLFDVTEAAFLKNGDLLLLERRFTIASGVAMRVRRIKGDEVKAGAVLTGEVILEGGLSNRIDNMEAMSVYENEKGETVLALMSDDNHSLLQRTIYLEFILPKE